ncbi:universal stress protein [Flavobacterium sp. J49]|uniref:universal stress protein n=1 Tax=Flavobacterium sp. J49 TaxID=2718534 RepID=UPI0015942BDB|nr:universal stress protein [Flavobacterium sp. J49]MBF6640036.1 universal stress protein [Flavobacterium sp. J49]NIC01281.1 universal stress protein [Flavobacterium sp. J49]
MKKILIPLDFSETSDNAFVYALEIAKLLKAELVLLHTFELPVVDNHAMSFNYATIYDTIELANFEHFKEKLPQLRSIASERKLDHITMNHILVDGDLLNNIKKVVVEENIDLVVMGTNGAEGWFDTFLGTNTGSVITNVEVPVLSVPADAEYQKIETIAFTTRFRPKDIDALHKVLFYAKKFQAQVKCLYVKTSTSDVTSETINRWKSHFEDEENLQFFIIPDEDVQRTIEDFLDNQSADMLAMLTYKRNFFVELFTTSTTQKLSYYLKTPILALHE